MTGGNGNLYLPMGPATNILLMTINYSHDIATALLAVSGIAMLMLWKSYPATADAATERYFISAYRGITRVAKDSLYWILLAGVPRIVFYMDYEWSDLAGDHQIIAVIIKHILMFLLVGTGVYSWMKLSRRVKALHEKQQTPA